MKRLLVFTVGLVCACAGLRAASDYPYMVFVMTDGTELAVASDNLDMTYSDGSLHLKSGKVNETLDVSKLLSMQFTDVNVSSTKLSADDQTEVDIFSTDGVFMGHFDSLKDASTLPVGIYVVQTKSKTYKVIF